MEKMDEVRESSITPLERYFTSAHDKIKAGHYDLSIDISLRETASKGLVDPLRDKR
jgi:hypothetical protein